MPCNSRCNFDAASGWLPGPYHSYGVEKLQNLNVALGIQDRWRICDASKQLRVVAFGNCNGANARSDVVTYETLGFGQQGLPAVVQLRTQCVGASIAQGFIQFGRWGIRELVGRLEPFGDRNRPDRANALDTSQR